MDLRSAPGMRITEWAMMGMWRKNLFGFLSALSARLPDFKFIAFCSGVENNYEFALVIDMKGEIHTAMGQGPSKNKAKSMAGEALLINANVHGWLAKHHANTMCDEYLLN